MAESVKNSKHRRQRAKLNRAVYHADHERALYEIAVSS